MAPAAGEDAVRGREGGAGGTWLPLALVLAVAAALRVLAIATIGDVALPHGDEGYYLTQATALAEGLGHPGAWRPPGYPVFLALVRIVTGDAGLQVLRAAQVVVGLVAVALVYALVQPRFGRRAAALSALALAVCPDAVHFCHFFWAEGVLATLLLLAVWCLMRARDSAGLRYVVAGAMVAAAAALTREMALYLVPFFVVWLAARDGWRWRRASIYVLVVALCIAPWTVRNTARLGSLVLISTNRWYPIADGNLATGPRPTRKMRELRRAYDRNPDELAREAAARTVALASIRAQQPWWIFRKLMLNPYLLFAPTRSQLARFAAAGWLDAGGQASARWLLPLESAVYLALLAVALAGSWLVPDAELKQLALVVLLVFLAVYVLSNGASRFRVPLLPFLLLWSGPVLSGFAHRARWRRIGLALTLGWVALVTFVDVVLQPRIPVSYAAISGVPDPSVLATAAARPTEGNERPHRASARPEGRAPDRREPGEWGPVELCLT